MIPTSDAIFMATFTQYLAEIDQCRTAMAAESYLAARKYLATARVTLMAIPDSEKTSGEKIEFQRQCDDLQKTIRELQRDSTNSDVFENGPVAFLMIDQVEELE